MNLNEIGNALKNNDKPAMKESTLSEYQKGVIEDMFEADQEAGTVSTFEEVVSFLFEDEDFYDDGDVVHAGAEYYMELADESGALEEAIRKNEKVEYNNLREAAGNVDKLYSTFDKASSAIDKAVNAVLDAADVLEDILVEATAIGGKIEDVIPQHVESIISTLTDIAENKLQVLVEGNGQSSISALKDLVGSIPYRDLKPETKEEKIAKISMKPNLSNGPRSAVLGGDTSSQQQQVHESAVLDFSRLREADGIGIDPEAGQINDFRELNMGLTGGSPAPYVSPIETANMIDTSSRLIDDSLLDGDTTDFDPIAGVPGVLSMDNINMPKASDGLTFDCVGTGDMMSEFASAGVNDSFGDISVPRR